MKVFTNLFLLVVLSFIGLSAYSASGSTPLTQLKKESLVVGSEQDFPPFATGMTDETAGGFTVDLWKAVANEADLKYTIRVLPFRQLLQEFKEGRIDVLINLAMSDERHQFADFSVPHVVVNGAIFVRKGDTRIRTESDLSDKSIIVINADLAHEYLLNKSLGKQLVLVDTVAEGFELLSSGKHDAFLLSKLVGMQSLRSQAITNVVPLKVKAGFSQKFVFAVQEGESELLGAINEAMNITDNNGTYSKLYEKWFGIYEVKDPSWRDLLKYIIPLFIVMSFISVYFYYKRHADRKIADRKLKESEERLDLATLHNGVGVWDWDLKTNGLIWHDSMYPVYQINPDGFSPSVEAWEDMLIQDDLVRVYQDIEIAKREKRHFRSEFRIHCPNNQMRYIKAEAQIFYDSEGTPVRMLGTNVDITELKNGEEKLKLAANVFNYAAEGIIVADANGLIIDVNAAFTKITGYSIDEVFGRNPNILKSGRQSQAFYASMWESIENEGIWTGEIWNRNKDGQIGPVLMSVSRVEDKTGKVQNYIALFTGIAEIKEHEHKLNEAISNAKNMLVSQQNFMAMLNHEIKTPLSVIRVTTGMQEITPARKLRIQQSVLDIDAILNRCLKADQIDNSSLVPISQLCDINQTLMTVKATFPREEHIKIDSPLLPKINTDEQLLHVVLNNLLDNALKYSEANTTVLVVATPFEDSGRSGVLISVANKPGLAGTPDPQQVFQKYYRNPAAHCKSGSGLGLYLVHNIIKLLGGWVSCHSSDDVVEFKVWLPV